MSLPFHVAGTVIRNGAPSRSPVTSSGPTCGAAIALGTATGAQAVTNPATIGSPRFMCIPPRSWDPTDSYPEPGRPNPRLLEVDDEPVVGELVAVRTRQLGWTVREQEALRPRGLEGLDRFVGGQV